MLRVFDPALASSQCLLFLTSREFLPFGSLLHFFDEPFLNAPFRLLANTFAHYETEPQKKYQGVFPAREFLPFGLLC